MIFELRDMIGREDCRTYMMMPTGRGTLKDEWVRAVPLPFYDGLLARLRSAWEVICGRAYICGLIDGRARMARKWRDHDAKMTARGGEPRV